MEANQDIWLVGECSLPAHYIYKRFPESRRISRSVFPEGTPSLVIIAQETDAPDPQEVSFTLAALSSRPPKAMVYISSVDVYGASEGELLHEESDSWADDEIGKTHILIEKMVWDWCGKSGVICTVLRVAPMFGSGVSGWQEEMFQAVNRGYFYLIRGNEARRSVVLAHDVAEVVGKIYPVGGVYNVADPRARSVVDLAEAMAKNGGRAKSVYRLPLQWARALAAVGDRIPLIGKVMDSRKLEFQLASLTFDVSALQQAIHHDFYDTVEVIARRDKNYPYEDD